MDRIVGTARNAEHLVNSQPGRVHTYAGHAAETNAINADQANQTFGFHGECAIRKTNQADLRVLNQHALGGRIHFAAGQAGRALAQEDE